MWKCSSCGNENKDEYRFCLSCGEPKGAPEEPKAAEEPKESGKKKPDSRSMAMTVLLLILALLLIAVIVVVIVNFPRLSGQAGDRRQEAVENSLVHRGESAEPTEEPENGGTSSYVFGTDSAVPTTAAPLQPAQTEQPAVTETPLPTEEPEEIRVVGDGEYLIPGSDSRYITEADLKDLSWEQCCLARNEIFARHGRIFVTAQISAYFSGKSWYRGTVSAADFNESSLNEYERANVNYIIQYESAHWGGSYY